MANYTNRQMILPANDKRTFGTMIPRTVVVHNTANRASADAEARYVHSEKSEVSYHYAIDDKECVQLLPDNKSGWHAGDGGKKDGGRYGIGVEICYSLDPGDKRYPIAEDNAAHKCAELLLKHKLPISKLSKHQDWSGKYCPHRMLDNRGWEPFVAKVKRYMDEMSGTGRMTTEAFIDRIKAGAIEGWKTHQILPSLTIAQAIVESDSGNSELATKANALFGIKAHTDPAWTRKYEKVTSEWVDGKYIQVKAAFKAYSTWNESIKDRLTYLTTRQIGGKYIYQAVIGEMDYKAAAQKIKDAGYATSPTYPASLIRIIEQYGLQQYDEVTKENLGGARLDKIVIAYVNDGDLPNALALFNVLGSKAMIIRTADASTLGAETVIQVGGAEVKGATKVIMGQDRAETLKEVAKEV